MREDLETGRGDGAGRGPRGFFLSLWRSHWRELIRREMRSDLCFRSSVWLLCGGGAEEGQERKQGEGHRVFQVGERGQLLGPGLESVRLLRSWTVGCWLPAGGGGGREGRPCVWSALVCEV